VIRPENSITFLGKGGFNFRPNRSTVPHEFFASLRLAKPKSDDAPLPPSDLVPGSDGRVGWLYCFILKGSFGKFDFASSTIRSTSRHLRKRNSPNMSLNDRLPPSLR